MHRGVVERGGRCNQRIGMFFHRGSVREEIVAGLRGSATLRRKGILFTRARSGGVYVHTARFLVTLLRAGRSYDGRRDDRRGKFTNLEPFFKPVDSFREARVTGDLRMISFPSTSLACLCL